MGIEENKATLKRYYDEMMNKGNLSLWNELMDDGYYLETPTTKTEAGFEAYKQGLENRKAGFSDGQFSIDEMIAEDDAVAIRGHVKGKNTGPIPAMGITAATGKQMNAAFAAVYYFKNGKIARCWTLHDVLTRFQQLGVTPPTG
jgi:predicted ester cyclase